MLIIVNNRTEKQHGTLCFLLCASWEDVGGVQWGREEEHRLGSGRRNRGETQDVKQRLRSRSDTLCSSVHFPQ